PAAVRIPSSSAAASRMYWRAWLPAKRWAVSLLPPRRRWRRGGNGWPTICRWSENWSSMPVPHALKAQGKSLLPIGVVDVRGEFQRGAIVACLDETGRDIARGLVNYSAEEARRVMRKPSNQIEAILGYVDEPELIHRDNLALL
nr:hypothetical protein [Hyphomicrobium sp.]